MIAIKKFHYFIYPTTFLFLFFIQFIFIFLKKRITRLNNILFYLTILTQLQLLLHYIYQVAQKMEILREKHPLSVKKYTRSIQKLPFM